MVPTDTCPIYEHDASIITTLTAQLPYSTSLLRRIQHGLSYPPPTAKILATFPPSGLSSTPTSGSPPEPETPWLAARVDLFRGRETQIFLYSSLEKTHASLAPIDRVTVTQSDGIDSTATTTSKASDESIVVSTFTAEPALLEQVRIQFFSLLIHVKKHLLPAYLASLNSSSSAEATSVPKNKTQDQDGTNDKTNGVPLIPPPPPQAFLIGSLHTALYALFMRSGIYAHAGKDADADPLPGLRIHRFDYPPYYKYFFRRAVFDPEAAGGEDEGGSDVSLPSGYRFHDRHGRTGVLGCHLDLVQSRTHIPRSRAQLSSMPAVAVYHDRNADGEREGHSVLKDENEEEKPIAWGFLGLDGALATLHVEPAHRGKGLALPLCRQIMRRGMASGVFGAEKLDFLSDGEREKVGEWVHTEVAQYNRASRRVMEKIGGEVLATVIWTVIEVCD